MSLEDLLNRLMKEGKLKRQRTNINYLNNLLVSAKRNYEAAFKLVYDGLLQIGRLILLMNGYRPDDGEQHKTTFLVAGELLGEDYHNLIRRIQKFRIKRNDCIYDPKGLISKIETDAIFKVSKEFWGKVKNYLEEKNPQLKLFNVF